MPAVSFTDHCTKLHNIEVEALEKQEIAKYMMEDEG